MNNPYPLLGELGSCRKSGVRVITRHPGASLLGFLRPSPFPELGGREGSRTPSQVSAASRAAVPALRLSRLPHLYKDFGIVPEVQAFVDGHPLCVHVHYRRKIIQIAPFIRALLVSHHVHIRIRRQTLEGVLELLYCHGLSLRAVVVLRIDLNLVAYEEQGGCGGYRQQRSYYNNAFHCI